MKEHPILFNGAMVRAVRSGIKTQTRRVVKYSEDIEQFERNADGSFYYDYLDQVDPAYVRSRDVPCPYGKPGDRLWVREAWARTAVYQAGCQEMVVYREGDNRTDYGGPWKPGIHMFRRDSRILLEINEVRVERLQSISEADALAEGIVQLAGGGYGLADGSHYHAADPRISYWSLWDAINGAGSVEANPWVWCVSFREIKP